MREFSFRTRRESLDRFAQETFDFLVIGGGITGAAVARDAASRGLKVALVERKDFAFGTSSRSSKLIHGGLRYLENFEFSLVFEALAERALLLRTAPHMVRPLPFYFPVYKGDPHSQNILGMGMWLYDFLALFRTPGFHKRLSASNFLKAFPTLKDDGLQGGFRYYDASMWDDVLAVQTVRSASEMGAAVANYVEALRPIREGERVRGFVVRDTLTGREIKLRAKIVIGCAGPWTDQLGKLIDPSWKPWLNPSKGVHLVFDLKRLPVPGALVMSHPQDGRISFVIPRPDFGAGVVLVGTTDAPVGSDPESASVSREDVTYLLDLLAMYFPKAELKFSDILSAYVGVRPLMHAEATQALAQVSREHHIGTGPGGTVLVAGGKYTTHRKMGEEIVDHALQLWKSEAREARLPTLPRVGKSSTRAPVNPDATSQAISAAREQASNRGVDVPEALLQRYGAAALELCQKRSRFKDPEGYPHLEAQLFYSIQNEMTVRLEDFYLRRVPLFMSRADGGIPWAGSLSEVWADSFETSRDVAREEKARLCQELDDRSRWKSVGTVLD
jgi:glycerol-3-phosphate dehydrogenase